MHTYEPDRDKWLVVFRTDTDRRVLTTLAHRIDAIHLVNILNGGDGRFYLPSEMWERE